MPFTDPRFLLLFLPAFLGLYSLAARIPRDGVPDGARTGAANWLIAAAGVTFLAAATGPFTLLVGAVAVATFALGRGIAGARRRAPASPSTRVGAVAEICFALAVTISVFLFTLYKFPNLLAGEITPWLDAFDGVRFPVPGLLAPLGLSILVCHLGSFITDVYRGDAAVARNPAHALAYLLFFPCLVAGPVLRYRDLSAQLAAREAGMAAVAYGVRRFTIGLAKVWLIAQTLAVPADIAFSMAPDALDAAHAWLGLACFTLQIYFDLSGYADMAVGLGRMLGFRLPENFQWPYAADTLHAFWRRWNMTLVAWFDAYLRLPLAPDPGAAAGRQARAPALLLLLFVLIGIWHGPSWPLLAWGALHGGVVALERTRWGTTLARLPAPARHAYVLLVVTLGWVFFRADTPAGAGVFLQALAGFGAAPALAAPLPLTAGVLLALVAGAIGAAPLLSAVSRWSVTVDAIATALQMIVTTAAMFVWTRVLARPCGRVGSFAAAKLLRHKRLGRGRRAERNRDAAEPRRTSGPET